MDLTDSELGDLVIQATEIEYKLLKTNYKKPKQYAGELVDALYRKFEEKQKDGKG